MDVIQLIVPQMVTLKTALTNFADDPDKIRGLCRILAEAGEAYRGLILHHPETFFPIVDGISICSAYHDLDIVLITFGFWYRLAQSLGKRSSTSPMFHDAYRNLVDVMVRHLHFPADGTSMTAQERDDFRAFRHRMGDTLKDCCYVLGTNNCLMFTYDLITGALSRAQTAGTPPAWQEIEAPLFSMRSMGAEVDLGDDEVMPRIMDLIPLLPTHPRIKYAAILVLSRYSEWIDRHPTYIPFTLSYISAGFEDPDEEVAAAAGQAMKYLCKDCKQHLGPYLENLYTFVHTVCPRLAQIERLQIFEAIAYVISSLPMEQAAQALRKFSFEVIEKIHVVLSKNAAATQNELQDIQDGLEQLEVMLAVVQTFGEVLPDACQNACPEAWIVFDALLIKYGSVYNVADRACRVLRLGIQFFGSSSLPVIPSLLDRMASCFESSGHSSYIWIVGKAVGHFGHEEDLAFRELFKNAYERISTKLLSMLQVQPPRGMPDVMEDYVHLLLQMVDFMPDVLFLSVAFPSAFNATLACLELPSDEIVFAALDLIRNIVGHDSIHPTESAKAPPPKFPLYAQAIRQAVEESGAFAVEHLMLGLVSTFSQDTTPLVVSILVTIARLWTKDISGWIVNAISKLPPSAVPAGVDATFINDFNLALSNADIDKVKAALHNINRSCRKLRDRRRDIDTGYD
jgi:transportin-3